MADKEIPGGYFLNPDGKSAHDANGNPIPLLVEDVPLVWSTPNDDTVPVPAAPVTSAEDVPAPVVVEVKPVEKKKSNKKAE